MEKERVCVTGGGGYQASWLIKLLLSKGYMVHTTVRDPNDDKNAHLKKLERASENLLLFKADLLDYDNLCSAIAGCIGVFHVASPVPPTNVQNPEVELIEPAVTGTSNVLKACSMSKVKRVVVVSSIAAVIFNPNWPKDRIMDESCWSDKEYCKTTELWYCLSKTEAEGQAMEYSKTTGLDVVTVCPSLILGPMLQSTVNASSLFLLKLLKDQLDTIENKHRSIVDARDVAEALVLAYEKTEAKGRYICAPHLITVKDLVNKLRSIYPNFDYPKSFGLEGELGTGKGVTSEKLKKLGWEYKTLEETLVDSVECYKEAGLLAKHG
ncbi:Cinnamoyl-coa reductase [Thalictrum thalictroides]|uniref:Cinnamoyl-coa reductase n=1 Tax=Thalictrum thalictroides TaxID=46969 RepID=A0A7J6WGP8_THATH|nr:Cinnamoyl-coa reductase [Thalictrum thalictroides]